MVRKRPRPRTQCSGKQSEKTNVGTDVNEKNTILACSVGKCTQMLHHSRPQFLFPTTRRFNLFRNNAARVLYIAILKLGVVLVVTTFAQVGTWQLSSCLYRSGKVTLATGLLGIFGATAENEKEPTE